MSASDTDTTGSVLDEDFFEQTIMERMVNELGYERLYGPDVPRTDERYQDVFLPGILEDSLRRVNASLPKQAIDAAIDTITADEVGSLPQRNERFSEWVQSGVEVRFYDGSEERNDIVRLIDYEHPTHNSFHVVNQWTYVEHENKRPDIVVFVNGMPLVVFELKSPSREETSTHDAYLQLRNYLKAIPSFFVPNAFLVMSDMATTKVGTITSPEDRFSEWKSLDGDYSRNNTRWQTTIDGMFRKDRLCDILRNFICFNDSDDKVVKILAAYHQYFGVHKAADRAVEAVAGDGRIGVFWHTQGSGKSLSMVFLAHMLQERVESPTIVVITDRNDLDDQLYGQFCRCAKFLRQTPVQATSRDNLRELLEGREANGIVFTTMQKFCERDEPLCDRSNVVVMIDEAHRGQYGLTETIRDDGTVSIGAAKQVRDALPNASYIGFTGTPIALDGRNTQEVFGGYIDVYDMTQAVEDEATVPVYYESRVVALHLDDDKLEELDRAYGEFADEHDDEAAERSKHAMGGLDAVLGAPETIDSLCCDIVGHYEQNREGLLTGKAMIVAYSRPIAMDIYYRLMELRPEWRDRVGVVMTTSNKDPEEWYDITHGTTEGCRSGGRRLDHKKDMERRFKSDDDPLKIAIVVDMWLTGFDVPSLATMYMYKPMRGHNLMQAIARVNRVYPGKEGGLIVDYIGIAGALKAAMRDYTKRDQKKYGDMDVAKTAYPKFREKLSVCRDILHGLDYEGRIASGDKQQIAEALADGTDWLLGKENGERREDFLKQAQLLAKAESLCKSMVSEEDQREAAFFLALRVQVLRILGRNGSGGKGMSYEEFNKRVGALLEQSVLSDGVINLLEDKGSVEVSLFDESFLDEVSKMKQKNVALETLKRLIKEQVREYKRTSVVKSQKFSEMLSTTLNRYLNGMLTNAEVIEELLKMAREMMAEREEGKKLGLTDEELAFYDALTKPQAVKDFYTNDQLVAMTHELTDALRKNATIDWQEKKTARAGMRRAIKRLLKKYKYPPDEQKDALDTVMAQCETWADNQTFDEEK